MKSVKGVRIYVGLKEHDFAASSEDEARQLIADKLKNGIELGDEDGLNEVIPAHRFDRVRVIYS